MAHKNRAIRKKRGSRTSGKGVHKRGSGGHGGVGLAGTHKSRWSWVIKKHPDWFGRRGFEVPVAVKQVVKALNLGDIEEIVGSAIEGKEKSISGVSWDKDKVVVDVTQLEYDKVLGKGSITRPMVVKARKFSKSAEEKIKSAGGEAVLVED